jgi:hypothetical protein
MAVSYAGVDEGNALMFEWLGKRGSAKPEDTASEFLEALTGSAIAVLQQVSDWVEEQGEGGNLSLALLRLADTRLEPVIAEIGETISTQRRVGTAPKLMRTYCERFARAYALVARQSPADNADRLSAYLRAAHLFSRACRLARMSYDAPGVLHQEIIDLFMKAQQHGTAIQRKAPYPGMAETSVGQELGVALLWDTAPFDSLTIDQVEYLERFITSFGNRIVLKTSPGATAPYAVLADGRVTAPGQADVDAAILFVGPGPLLGQMAGIVKLPDSGGLPAWAGTPLPHTDMQTLKALALRMSSTWERKHVQRGSARQTREDSVRVTGGFDNIRRVVAYAAYVRGGGQLEAYDTRDRAISDRVREIMVGLEDEKRQLTPVEVLAAMETIGDSQAVESWSACDSSAQGYSLAMPGFRNWIAVGGLLAVRESDSIDWHVAVVRRLYGSSRARRVGVEMFRGNPVPVGMGHEGQTANVGLAEMRDAILITGDPASWLVTSFACQLGGTYLVAGHHGRRLFKVTARCSGNADYEVSVVEPVDACPS